MVRARIAALAAGLSVASCGSSARRGPAPPASRTDPDAVHVVGRTFRDGRGRELLFRGYNAKAAPVYDVTFDDGRTANATFTDFSPAFAARLEELGMNALRLPVNWSNFEPFPLAYNDAFLARIETVLQLAHAHHFYVLIDMHQDAYS